MNKSRGERVLDHLKCVVHTSTVSSHCAFDYEIDVAPRKVQLCLIAPIHKKSFDEVLSFQLSSDLFDELFPDASVLNHLLIDRPFKLDDLFSEYLRDWTRVNVRHLLLTRAFLKSSALKLPLFFLKRSIKNNHVFKVINQVFLCTARAFCEVLSLTLNNPRANAPELFLACIVFVFKLMYSLRVGVSLATKVRNGLLNHIDYSREF